MEHMMGRWHPTKPDKHPELVADVTLCHKAYNKIGIDAPNAVGVLHTMMVTAMPDTGASMRIV